MEYTPNVWTCLPRSILIHLPTSYIQDHFPRRWIYHSFRPNLHWFHSRYHFHGVIFAEKGRRSLSKSCLQIIGVDGCFGHTHGAASSDCWSWGRTSHGLSRLASCSMPTVNVGNLHRAMSTEDVCNTIQGGACRAYDTCGSLYIFFTSYVFLRLILKFLVCYVHRPHCSSRLFLTRTQHSSKDWLGTFTEDRLKRDFEEYVGTGLLKNLQWRKSTFSSAG